MEERAYAEINPGPESQGDLFDAPPPRRGTPPPWWRRRPIQLLAAAVAVATCIGAYFALSSGTGQVHVHGTLTLAAAGTAPDANGCQGGDGYSDITPGTAVTVGGAQGQTLGIGALSAGQVGEGSSCVFSFDVAVPSGQSVYTVTISHRGTQTVSTDELANGIALTLGQ